MKTDNNTLHKLVITWPQGKKIVIYGIKYHIHQVE